MCAQAGEDAGVPHLRGGEGDLGEPRGAGRKELCSVCVAAEPREGRAQLRTPFLQ